MMNKKDQKKYCPLLGIGYCKYEECEWWKSDSKKCAVVVISEGLYWIYWNLDRKRSEALIEEEK